jgi:NhaP-type Na+/H+ or K+/H+ antiporter
MAAGAVGGLPASLGLGVIIGAILAPTDPALASSVGLGPPGKGEEGEVRFALTSEAGLNDGMAFPFLVLGLAMLVLVSIAVYGLSGAAVMARLEKATRHSVRRKSEPQPYQPGQQTIAPTFT